MSVFVSTLCFFFMFLLVSQEIATETNENAYVLRRVMSRAFVRFSLIFFFPLGVPVAPRKVFDVFVGLLECEARSFGCMVGRSFCEPTKAKGVEVLSLILFVACFCFFFSSFFLWFFLLLASVYSSLCLLCFRFCSEE